MVSALSGDLPCLRCRYNLRGLSVLGACPECGTPVRATLLSVVDPFAGELRPVRWRRTVAWGLVVWGGAALAAAILLWTTQAADALEVLLDRPLRAAWPGQAAIAAIALSGVAALVLIRPHAGISMRNSLWAMAGVAAYLPMIWYGRRLAAYGFAAGNPYLRALDVSPARAATRLVFEGCLVVALLGLRPNARLLASRSLLMREGRVDRQTMLALVAAVALGMLGDAVHWQIRSFPAGWVPVATVVGTLLIAVSSLLITVGLVGILVDAWRIREVILEPPPTLRELIERQGMGT